MKLRIAQKKLKSSTVNIWAKSIDEWMQARDVANKLNDTDLKLITLKFIHFDKKQAILAGNKVGVTRSTVIEYYLSKTLNKLYYGKGNSDKQS